MPPVLLFRLIVLILHGKHYRLSCWHGICLYPAHMSRHTKNLANRNRPSRRSGWSLIELMVVMALLTVFATLAWPVLDQLFQRGRLRVSSMALIQTLRTARHQAMVEGRSYQVVFRSADGEYTVTGGNRPPQPMRLHQSIEFGAADGVLGPPSRPMTQPPEDGVSFRGDQVTFRPDGTLSPGPGTIYLSVNRARWSNGLTMAISLNMAGHLRRYQWEEARWVAM